MYGKDLNDYMTYQFIQMSYDDTSYHMQLCIDDYVAPSNIRWQWFLQMMQNRVLRHNNNFMEEEYFVGLKIRESIVLAF